MAVASSCACLAQNSNPVLLGAGNVSPFPLSIAPGQILTLFVQPATTISPVTASDVSATFASIPMPVLQVVPAGTGCTPPLTSSPCTQVLAVTVQVPYGIRVLCPPCASPAVSSGDIVVSVDGAASPGIAAQPLQDKVHFLTACDVVVAGGNASPLFGALPCAPLVTHADGRQVSNILPAKAGEELVAYATGLGETNPPLTAGKPAAQSSPTVTTFGIDFNFRANVLATQPSAVGVPTGSPLFTGATQGYVGLYQINFVVPRPPAGLSPCINNATLPSDSLAVVSNLTISVGSAFSFDGAGICVTPAS